MLRGVARPRVQTAVGWRRHPAASVLGGSNVETKRNRAAAFTAQAGHCVQALPGGRLPQEASGCFRLGILLSTGMGFR